MTAKKPKKLYKSDDNKIFTGVLGGIGEYYSIDPTILRLGWIVISMLTGFFPGVIAYILAALITPTR